jgi:hypothetical protein
MTTVRQIIRQYLDLHDFDGLAGDECGCSKTDMMPCDACPDQCVPGYRWECGQCPSGVEERCDFLYGNGGCYRATRQVVP